ncbi:helix-turn-helix transcriptional regulator [Rhodococcus spongiicola]|uniref:WYL domain-containing protein n=1 Tax=Rhodococcus spongiicola TaxID=2487352 RepID=A0A438AQP6_9NOCA|nr:WYL domain-containing protein [Rhodococcus spongiicola]RVW00864.1 WYL domain-containing protein [Rhodococcus spongiicola]
MSAKTTSELVLELLGLLQTHRQWAGPELAKRLDMTPRTLRRYVERVREMGYQVEAVRGRYGGYRLVAGSSLPPLVFNDLEAVAIAASLRVAAAEGLVDGQTTTTTAIAKFEQILPARLRARVSAVAEHVTPLNPGRVAPTADAVGALALACRDREVVNFAYTTPDRPAEERSVEPVALVPSERAWFVVCWDRHKEGWRTFRADRMTEVRATGETFRQRDLPADSPADFVRESLSRINYVCKAEVVLTVGLREWVDYAKGWAQGSYAVDDVTTRWPIGAQSLQDLMIRLSWIPEPIAYTVETDSTTAEGLRRLATRVAVHI